MPLTPAFRDMGRQISKFKASLDYRPSSRTARDAQRNRGGGRGGGRKGKGRGGKGRERRNERSCRMSSEESRLCSSAGVNGLLHLRFGQKLPVRQVMFSNSSSPIDILPVLQNFSL